MKAYQRNDTFNLAGGGVISMTWPDRMSAGDLEDFNDWFDLMKSKINRIAKGESHCNPAATHTPGQYCGPASFCDCRRYAEKAATDDGSGLQI